MIGAIIGDIVGSRYEFRPVKSKNFELFVGEGYIDPKEMTVMNFKSGSRFTDDTVMTLCVCKALLECNGNYDDLSQKTIYYMQEIGNKYPLSGYGFRFCNWLMSRNPLPYNSFGNGSAMRISPVPYFAKSEEQCRELARKVTEITHNHPEGLKGAEAVAMCIWLAKNGKNKMFIKDYVEKHYYKLDFDYSELLERYDFNETCQGSVPQSIYCFLISNSYEDTIRTAISLGGDADTMACIAGSIAEAFYGVPEEMKTRVLDFLSPELKNIYIEFQNKMNV